MVLSIAQEIRHAVERLISSGEETRIDLQVLPLGLAEIEALEAVLGRGEVEARIDSLGLTLIQETAIPGVWRVDSLDGTGRLLSRHLEIAKIPAILHPHPEDLAAVMARLDDRLSTWLAGSQRASIKPLRRDHASAIAFDLG